MRLVSSIIGLILSCLFLAAFIMPASAQFGGSDAFLKSHPGYAAAVNSTASLAGGGASGPTCSSGPHTDSSGSVTYDSSGKNSCGYTQWPPAH